jgi:hypothetical protein
MLRQNSLLGLELGTSLTHMHIPLGDKNFKPRDELTTRSKYARGFVSCV